MLSPSRMFSFLLFAVLCASCLANSTITHYSFSPAVGGAHGHAFSTEGVGRITGIRVWELNNAYIAGIQLRYGHIWTPVVGRVYGGVHELLLYDDEGISQLSGKTHSNYIYQVIFVTTRGRFLIVGQPYQRSFNLFPSHPDAELTLLSGRKNHVGVVALAAHWGVVSSNSTDTED